ncbi:MAG: butyryl-CoA:acetate CoA-transferase [Synergistaceae bacterium]|jgi:butyryl-CoA:acetate CoA-transferase|nr:butyryl-CoA:acetate CoA-transferase [Synergistaceae bacterium]
MDYSKEYAKKLVTPEKAVEAVQSGQWIDYGWGVAVPVALDKALAKVMPSLHRVNIRGGMVLRTPEIFKIESPAEHFTWNSWHMTGVDRKTTEMGFGFYAPIRYSELPRYYRDMPADVDVALFQVHPMDKHGYFNFGPSVSHMAAVCGRAKAIVVEVNESLPYCLGGEAESVHISRVDMVVEGENQAMPTIAPPEITEVDETVAKLIVERIPDGACLQIGIGGMPSAVGAFIAKSDLKDLGIHTEMYVDAMVDIAMAGKINGSKKNVNPGRQTYAFAAGTQKLYDYIDHNPACMTAPVDYCNDVRVLASLDNFMSINNAVDVDLFGQVSSETSGLKHISGAGGQLDFVLGAYLSKGGKSFICCSSTMKGKDGQLQSRIVPTLKEGSVVTDTRANLHYLVTEYGIVNVKGLSTWQKAEAIISVAHPQFRENLIQSAEKMRIWSRSNKLEA